MNDYKKHDHFLNVLRDCKQINGSQHLVYEHEDLHLNSQHPHIWASLHVPVKTTLRATIGDPKSSLDSKPSQHGNLVQKDKRLYLKAIRQREYDSRRHPISYSGLCVHGHEGSARVRIELSNVVLVSNSGGSGSICGTNISK